jgi:hypothetical protein
MTNLLRRLKKLEARSDPRGPVRLVVRYETGDPQDADKTESDVDENDPNTLVVVVQYVDMPSKARLGPARGAAGLATRIANDIGHNAALYGWRVMRADLPARGFLGSLTITSVVRAL